MKPLPSQTKPMQDLPHKLALQMKDGIRGLRFAARHGARQLVDQIVASGARAPHWAPPLDDVARHAIGAVEGLDRMVVQLVSSAHEYRSGNFQLLSIRQRGDKSLANCSSRAFERNFYWLYKHLLRLAQRDDVSVREDAIHQAWLQFRALLDELTTEPGAEGGPATELQLACLVQCLVVNVLPQAHGLTRDPNETRSDATLRDDKSLSMRLAIAAAFAGEIAFEYPRSTLTEEVRHALELALQVANSRQAEWHQALQSPNKAELIGREMAFVLRHI